MDQETGLDIHRGQFTKKAQATKQVVVQRLPGLDLDSTEVYPVLEE